MGPEDRSVLDYVSTNYPRVFLSGQVIDGGSRQMNGTVYHFLGPEAKKKFIGIDLFEPQDWERHIITWTGYIHDYPGEDVADLVTCFNTFEHDIHWQKSVRRLMELLKPEGIFLFQLVCSGAEHGNVNPDEPYGEELEDGTRYYRNMNPHEFDRFLDSLWGDGMRFTVEGMRDILEGHKGVVDIDHSGERLEASEEFVSTRRYFYYWGYKH